MAFTRLNISLKLLGIKMSPDQALMGPMRLATPKIACGKRGDDRKEQELRTPPNQTRVQGQRKGLWLTWPGSQKWVFEH